MYQNLLNSYFISKEYTENEKRQGLFKAYCVFEK